MSFLVNALAKHDVAVARYYLGRGAPLAAANRAQNVLQRYPQAYEQMGMPELAGTSRRVLEKNFPKNNMITKTSASGKAWWKLW